MRRKLLITILALAVLGGWYLYDKYGYLTQSAKNWPRNTKEVKTEPTSLSPLESDQELSHISLPDGFAITYYASDVPGARSMTMGENGVLYVGTRSQGVVYALEDADSDKRADTRYTVSSGLTQPNGVAYHEGDLYVAEIGRIIVFRNIDDTYSGSPSFEVVYDDLPKDTHHGWRFMDIGPDGKIYVAIGAPCNICDPGDPYASIARLNTDGSGFEVIARGIRNSVGFDWHPESGNLFFTDNGRDWLGDDTPPDELNVLESVGQHFGYPYCHGGTVTDPEFGEGRTCGDYTSPAQTLGPHVAALGIDFYEGTAFQEEYQNKLFIAEHGSWNRSTPIGYRVTMVDYEGDSASNYETFASGWLDDSGEATGRPVDILEMEDGSILVSDDLKGAVYRISSN